MNIYTATPTRSARLLAARAYAAVKHSGQIYKPDAPYTDHLNAVENQLRKFGIHEDNGRYDESLLIAGQLHDVIEDGLGDKEVLGQEIKNQWGSMVLDIVLAVTDKAGQNRQERHLNTYPHLAKNPAAVKVKLGDRLANIERGLEEGAAGKGSMYIKEDEYFQETLRTPGQAEEMWAEYRRAIALIRTGLGRSRGIGG